VRVVRAFAFAVVTLFVVGCTTPSGAGPFPAQHVALEVPETASYPGLRVTGSLDGAGHKLTVQASADNEGNRTYRVETGCTTPWSEDLRSDRETLLMREPTATCLAYALSDYAPGEEITREFVWDGKVWSNGNGYTDARPGDYVWSIRFVAYSPDGAALKRFDLDFPVTVR
jgi:hypothetical protein